MSSNSAVFNGRRRVPVPVNEPIKSYAPGSPERASLKARLKTMAAETVDMPLFIGGKEIRTGDTASSVMPHDHQHVLVIVRHHRRGGVAGANLFAADEQRHVDGFGGHRLQARFERRA